MFTNVLGIISSLTLIMIGLLRYEKRNQLLRNIKEVQNIENCDDDSVIKYQLSEDEHIESFSVYINNSDFIHRTKTFDSMYTPTLVFSNTQSTLPSWLNVTRCESYRFTPSEVKQLSYTELSRYAHLLNYDLDVVNQCLDKKDISTLSQVHKKICSGAYTALYTRDVHVIFMHGKRNVSEYIIDCISDSPEFVADNVSSYIEYIASGVVIALLMSVF